MNYVEVAIPFFVLAMLLELAYGRFTGKQTYRLNDSINSLQLGTLSQLNNVLRLGVSASVLGGLAVLIGVPQWTMSDAWHWAAAFVAYDFCYYWKHRFGHEWRIMWASHVAHHQSEEFNLSTALRQTGTDYIGFVFYVPLYLAGIPATAIITVGSLNLIYQFWVHTEHIRRLGPLEWIFVTPSNHRVHHARNDIYLDKNYGGVFIVWDRIFATFKDELDSEPCKYGITTGLNSWNPLWANVHVWWDTARLAWRATRWRDKFAIWFKAPAWTPADTHAPQKLDARAPKFDPAANAFTKGYVFVQYWLLLGAALWLQKADATVPRAFTITAFAWICFAFYVQGTWLEARAYAAKLEWARLAGALSIAGLTYSLWPESLSSAAYALAAYSLVSAAVLLLPLLSNRERSLHA